MLTQQEKDWLERRKNLCSRCEFCLYDTPCEDKGENCKAFLPSNMREDFRDAARFYALALEFLARPKPCAFIHFEGFSEGIKMCGRYDPRHGCRPCELRRAMLRAEKDMEGKHA